MLRKIWFFLLFGYFFLLPLREGGVLAVNTLCQDAGFYNDGPSQEGGLDTTFVSLGDVWDNYYVPFTAPFSGNVNGILVKAGNSGGAVRAITCKVTDANGSNDISAVKSSKGFSGGSVVAWRAVDFKDSIFSLSADVQYRLYCHGPDTFMKVYWIKDWDKGDINGKTYSVCMLAPVATATPVPTTTPAVPTATPTPCPSYSGVKSFKYRQTASPWWQTRDGDVHAGASITSMIPACAVNKYLSLVGAEGMGMPGVVSWYGADPNLGQGSISQNPPFGWQAKKAYSGSTTFDYLVNRLNVNTSAETFTGTMPTTSGTYYSSSGKTLSGNFPAGSKIVIFVNGDVTVSNNVIVPIVPAGGFFALIVKGDLTFAGAVTKAQGFFLANGTLSVASANNLFEGQGSFTGLGGVSLNRNLGPGQQNCSPAELFILRPDLYLNAPSDFLFTPSVFQEVAP